jgi:Tol biopolymer transport system component
VTTWKTIPLTILLAVATAANLAAQSLELISRVHPSQIADTGAAANTATQSPDAPNLPLTVSISDDGRYVAFVSRATNLVAGQQDTNSQYDVFLRDLLTGVTTLVSRSMTSPLRTGGLGSDWAAISGDGRYVAFVSRAKDLAPGQSGDFFGLDTDLLFYDRAADTITLVTRTTGPSVSIEDLAINADGRYIAFTSAGNFVPGDDTNSRDVFLYDQVTGTIRLVSQPAAAGASWKPVISPDGRFVVFQNLDDGSGSLFDRTSDALTPLGSVEAAAFSANGRYLTFTAKGSLSLYDLQTRTTTSPLNGGHDPITNNRIAISDDGRFTVFSSSDPSLPGQSPLFRTLGLYLFDRIAGTFTLVRLESPVAPVVGSHPSISGDGRFVVFVNSRPDVVPGQTDENESHDVFLFDRTTGKTTLLSAAGASSAAGDRRSYRPLISRNGARVVFESLASNLVPEIKDFNDGEDVYLYETASGIRSAVTLRAPEAPSLTPDAAVSRAGALSADGRFVAFDSDSPHLLASLEDGNGGNDVFLYDAVTKSTLLVSRSLGSATRTANGGSGRPVISADGRYVLYVSGATDLAPGTPDPNERASFFLFDRVAGTNRFVGSAVAQVFNQPPEMTISADGRWVAYISDLIPGQPPRAPVSVLLWDRETGSTTLVSHSRSAATERANDESLRAGAQLRRTICRVRQRGQRPGFRGDRHRPPARSLPLRPGDRQDGPGEPLPGLHGPRLPAAAQPLFHERRRQIHRLHRLDRGPLQAAGPLLV